MDEKLNKSFPHSAEHLLSAKQKDRYRNSNSTRHTVPIDCCVGIKGKGGFLEEALKMSRISAGRWGRMLGETMQSL